MAGWGRKEAEFIFKFECKPFHHIFSTQQPQDWLMVRAQQQVGGDVGCSLPLWNSIWGFLTRRRVLKYALLTDKALCGVVVVVVSVRPFSLSLSSQTNAHLLNQIVSGSPLTRDLSSHTGTASWFAWTNYISVSNSIQALYDSNTIRITQEWVKLASLNKLGPWIEKFVTFEAFVFFLVQGDFFFYLNQKQRSPSFLAAVIGSWFAIHHQSLHKLKDHRYSRLSEQSVICIVYDHISNDS